MTETIVARSLNDIKLGRIELRIKPQSSPYSFLIGQDVTVFVDGEALDWARISSIKLGLIKKDEPITLTLELLP